MSWQCISHSLLICFVGDTTNEQSWFVSFPAALVSALVSAFATSAWWIDTNSATTDLSAIQLLHCTVDLSWVSEFDESEATTLARFPIHRDANFDDVERRESFTHVVL